MLFGRLARCRATRTKGAGRVQGYQDRWDAIPKELEPTSGWWVWKTSREGGREGERDGGGRARGRREGGEGAREGGRREGERGP